MQLELQRQRIVEPDNERFGEAAFVSVLKKAGADSSSAELWRQVLAHIVVATTSHAVRNAAALALLDRGGRDYADALVEAIRRPELANHNGTLLFALDELGGTIPLDLVVQLIEQGSYEGTAEALLFFEDDRVTVPGDQAAVRSLQDKLERLRSAADPTVSEAADQALARVAFRPS